MTGELVRAIAKVVAPLQRRVQLGVSRAVVKMVNDSLKCQGLQISMLAGELQDGVEHFQPYGFTAHPKPGAEGVFLSVGGNRSHGIVVCVGDRRYRLKGLEEGEVALYDDQGSKVHLKRGGTIEISAEHVKVGGESVKPAARKDDPCEVTTSCRRRRPCCLRCLPTPPSPARRLRRPPRMPPPW